MTAAWQAALQDACNVLSDLDESDLEGTTDFEGKANFHLVEILMEQMAGRRVPFEDRASVLLARDQLEVDHATCSGLGLQLG